MRLRMKNRARYCGRVGCDCCNSEMFTRKGRTALKRRLRKIEKRALAKDILDA